MYYSLVDGMENYVDVWRIGPPTEAVVLSLFQKRSLFYFTLCTFVGNLYLLKNFETFKIWIFSTK